MADAPGKADAAAVAPPPAAPADALAAAALGAPTSGDGRAPPAGAGEGSERSRSPSLPPRQRRHAPRRGGGRRSYNLEGLGFCVEVCVDEQYISDNGLEVRKGKAYKCAFCEKTLAALRDGVPTTKMQDHLAKCDNLPADKVPELNEATGGTFQRRRANSTRGRRSTQTVVMQPLVPQGSVGGTAQQGLAPNMQSAPAPSSAAVRDPAQQAPEGRMLRFMDHVAPQHASEINMAIMSFIVGCELPFAVVQSVYFTNLLSVLRPGFIAKDWRMSRTGFSTSGLDKLYEQIKDQLHKALHNNSSTNLFTLAGDGFKAESGDKVVNFTEQLQTKLAFKDSQPVGEAREDSGTYVPLFKQQLETRAIEEWTGVVADNVGYMRSTLNELELMFPNLICIGCVVHVLDLLCEDYAKLLMEYVNMANKIVVFVTGHDRVCQLFLRLKGPQGTGLRTFPDTGFSYASLMLSSVLTNKRTLRDMPDDPAWEDVSTHKDGSPMADREWFVDSIEERRIFLKFSCALALLQPVTDAIRFMEGDYARISFVYLIMLSLAVDVSNWQSLPLDGDSADQGEPSLASKASAAFAARWNATGRLQAALYHPVHMVSLFLDPYLCRIAPALPVNAVAALTALFRKFCSSESEVTQCVNEFMKFHNGDGGYRMMKEFAEQAHEQEFQSMKEKYLQDNSLGSLPSEVVKAILYCQASMACGNCPITWWKTMGKTLTSAKKLAEIAIRILSLAPHAAPVERMNSIHKVIQTKGRAALKHPRVVKMLYCYVNMRLLDSVDEEMRSMIEDMLVQEVAAADMEAATSSNNATDDGQQGQQGDGGDQDNGQPGEAGAIVLEGATV